MSERPPLTLKTQRVRCWNCERIMIIPYPLDRSTDPPTHIVPYGIKCPHCGDSIYKFMSIPDSGYIQ